MQLSPMNTLPAQGDYFPSGGNMGGPAPAGGSPLSKLHRLLRGRYPIVVVLGLIFGSIGAVAGYFSQKPGYSAVGTLEVSPFIKSAEAYEKTLPMFNAW